MFFAPHIQHVGSDTSPVHSLPDSRVSFVCVCVCVFVCMCWCHCRWFCFLLCVTCVFLKTLFTPSDEHFTITGNTLFTPSSSHLLLFTCDPLLLSCVCVCDLFLFDKLYSEYVFLFTPTHILLFTPDSVEKKRSNLPRFELIATLVLYSHLSIFTETTEQSPNTGARANNTLHK